MYCLWMYRHIVSGKKDSIETHSSLESQLQDLMHSDPSWSWWCNNETADSPIDFDKFSKVISCENMMFWENGARNIR